MGITTIELAETVPPYFNDPPMKVLFGIPTKPPPVLKDADKYTSPINDFIAKCLTKSPEERASADELLQVRMKGNCDSMR